MSDAAPASPARPLAGRLAVVAGASRGVGRGIAVALGEAGASVVCVARSTRFGSRTDGRPETVEDAAEAVSLAGGDGHPYVCDCTDPRALHALAAWVLRRLGPPDVLALSVWRGAEGFDGRTYADGSAYGTAFHQRSLAGLEAALESGPFAVLATARAFVPLLQAAGAGLVVTVGFDAEGEPLGDPWHELGMEGIRQATDIVARTVGSLGLAAVHLTPGFVRTERVIDAGRGEQATESPLYAGRAVAALAADPAARAWNGRSLFVADLARHYGFTDADGGRPERFRPSAEGAGSSPA